MSQLRSLASVDFAPLRQLTQLTSLTIDSREDAELRGLIETIRVLLRLRFTRGVQLER